MDKSLFENYVKDFQDFLLNGLNGKCKSGFYSSKINSKRKFQDGDYAVLDIGGTNVRTAWVKTTGGKVEIIKHTSTILENFLDINQPTNVDTFFSRITDWLPEYFEDLTNIGFCFSFGMNSTDELDGKVTMMTKNIKIDGIMGSLIGEELSIKLMEKFNKTHNITVLNDTIATFLAGRSNTQDVDLSLIEGTGYNTAFVDKSDIIINSESGQWLVGFNEDKFKFETKVSGKYLPDIFTSGIENLIANDSTSKDTYREYMKITTTKELNALYTNENTPEEIRSLINKIIRESAELVAVQLCGYIDTLNIDKSKTINISTVGSVIWGFSNYRNIISRTISEYFGEDIQINYIKVENATLLGAGIAASMY